jgi:hypothetical protein
MGTGRTLVTGTLRPEKPDPDFTLGIQIVKTQLHTLNKALKAHADLDVARGNLSFFSEFNVRDRQVQGYVKPLFKGVEVYHPDQDRDKAASNKLYQAVVGGVLDLLKNRPRQQVAAETEISGPIENPEANTWQIIGTLVRNAIFEAILPRLKQEYGRG